jgi:uncharacterized protein (TIGR00369 family)
VTPVVDLDGLRAFMVRDFPEAADELWPEEVTADGMILRLRVQPRHLRPGATVSGPAMFLVADVAVYLAILSRIGLQALTVTTNASLDFLHRPAAGQDLLATARVLKIGQRLAVGDVLVTSGDRLVARGAMTYAREPGVPRAKG